MSTSKGEERWFDEGCAAFKRSFPGVAKHVPSDRFYVCPICLRAYGHETLAAGILTREHVPPQSIGGRRMVLTCRRCNNEGGHAADNHARIEADLFDFATGNLRRIKANLRTQSGRVPIRLSSEDRNFHMVGVPHASDPRTHAGVLQDFEGATVGPNWQDFSFTIEFPAFCPERARSSWLRSTYLAFFAALGYRFIFRPELDVVRARIREPEANQPKTFRLITVESFEPTLLRIKTPEALRSYTMLHSRNAIFLPRYNDHELYTRLEQSGSERLTATISTIQYPWPKDGPTFFHDREAA
jgi:hypothetical protein